jgi:precorrin-2 dehydrogenase/sirohydrochlorin ferrochelatase
MRRKNTVLSYYPVALNLKDKLSVIVGGGNVSERKLKGFLRSGAIVKVISPRLTPELQRLFEENKFKWVKKEISSSDLNSADIVIAATSDRKVNESVSRWSKRRKILVNVVDQSSLSSFISPAVFRKQKAAVAVYTDGRNPAISRDLKNFLKEHWDEFLSYRDRLRKGSP